MCFFYFGVNCPLRWVNFYVNVWKTFCNSFALNYACQKKQWAWDRPIIRDVFFIMNLFELLKDRYKPCPDICMKGTEQKQHIKSSQALIYFISAVSRLFASSWLLQGNMSWRVRRTTLNSWRLLVRDVCMLTSLNMSEVVDYYALISVLFSLQGLKTPKAIKSSQISIRMITSGWLSFWWTRPGATPSILGRRVNWKLWTARRSRSFHIYDSYYMFNDILDV